MLQVVELSGSRGTRQLFSQISFSVKPGQMLTVTGENGSGKTSLLRMLCRLVPPDRGMIRWQGEDIRKLKDLYHSRLTYLGHLNGIKDDLTPVENLKISACLSGDERSDTSAREALEAVGLGRYVHRLPTRVLSQGQKRRVALARLWLSTHPLWILDEPFTSLDAAATGFLTRRLQAHTHDGGMVVVATHQEVEIAADSVQRLRLTG